MWKCTLGTSLLAAGFMALALAGCGQGTTQNDVTAAQDKARAEERKSEQAREDAQKELAAKQQKVEESRREAMKPVANTEEELQKTRDQQAEKIRKQDEKTRAAEEKVATTQEKFTVEKDRDAYIANAEARIKDADERIELLGKQSKDLQGDAKKAADLKIDELKQARDRVKTELSKTKSAETLQWQDHRAETDQALTRLHDLMQQTR
jgi:hypothetical protein